MKTKTHSQSGIFNPRILAAFALGSAGVLLAALSFAANANFVCGVPATSASDGWAAGCTPIEHWNGTTWSIVTSPNTGGLSGVTCTSPSDCWAVGSYRNGFYNQTLIEHWNGTAWSIVTSPNTSTTQSNGLSGVTCTSASNCWAVGSYYNLSIIKTQPHHTLTERCTGTALSIVTSPTTTTTDYNQLIDVAFAS